MNDIRDCILLAIESGGYKKAEIAKRAGLTPMQFCDIIKKRRKLEANEFLAICDAIHLGPQDVRNFQVIENQPA